VVLPSTHIIMSIAVSAVVHPSRLLFAMVGVMAAGSALIGVAIGLGVIGDLSPVARASACIITVFLSFFGFYHGVRHRKPIHIDISGTGQLRLTEVIATTPCRDKYWPHLEEIGEMATLMSDSTLLPHLLLLRLRTANGIAVLPILPDSVSRDSFRALSVACRWIATQGERPESKAFRNCSE
jgi:toxin CptA